VQRYVFLSYNDYYVISILIVKEVSLQITHSLQSTDNSQSHAICNDIKNCLWQNGGVFAKVRNERLNWRNVVKIKKNPTKEQLSLSGVFYLGLDSSWWRAEPHSIIVKYVNSYEYAVVASQRAWMRERFFSHHHYMLWTSACQDWF
jgi:hypothetical protein